MSPGGVKGRPKLLNMRFQHLPNAITISRLFLVPLLILALRAQDYFTGLLLFLVAGISDALDGFIAKRFDSVSRLGAILDPVADKALLISAYVMLAVVGDVPFWLSLTVVFRDLLIIGGYLVVISMMGPVEMQPSYLSKFNTLMQIVLIVAILAQNAAGLDFPVMTLVLIYTVLITTVASGAHYLWLWLVKREINPVNKKELS
ncbi:MAG: CDP-alcohol phosphatidyltransferase family protein [Gammaproteobacteria bacterium]|nr:MAG: CDP-alcohol phosphatidyltransferase family protein [Gammaproteobacteria bacterium]